MSDFDLRTEVATANFLEECRKLGIRRVAVGVQVKGVPVSLSWSLGSVGSNCAFQWPTERKAEDGWPAIWRAAERAGVDGRCANHGQTFCHDVAQGYYLLQKDGTWKRRGDE